jgi:CBS domain containing-hemolysin-like protein
VNVAVSIGLSVLLLLANAFFVAAEFAVVSAKRHRLEVAAAFGGSSARAAVRNSRELSLGLAGAQLGITLATLGLGALAKPAVADCSSRCCS